MICARESIWFLSRRCRGSLSRPRALALAHTLSLTRSRCFPCSCSRVLSVIFRVRALVCSLVCVYVSHPLSLSHTLSPSPPSFLHSFFLSSLSCAVCLSVSSSFHILALPLALSHTPFLVHCLSLSLALFLSLGHSYLARAHCGPLTNHALTHTHRIHMHTRTQKYMHACTQKYIHASDGHMFERAPTNTKTFSRAYERPALHAFYTAPTSPVSQFQTSLLHMRNISTRGHAARGWKVCFSL